jgi:Uma2 family endonuclease
MARQGAEMATQTIPETTPAVMRRRFTVAEYQRMDEVGIFSEENRVELIAGEIYQMRPIGIRHARCVNRLTIILSRHLEAGIAEAWIVDLAAETIERCTDPRDGLYHLVARARRGESLASTVLPALIIPVADMLK